MIMYKNNFINFRLFLFFKLMILTLEMDRLDKLQNIY